MSGYCEWPESSHAELWLVIPCENMVEYLCIDETASSNGELYTVVTNRVSHVGKGTLVAIIKGVSAGTVIETLMRIDEVLNFSVNWAANAFAESFNAKFKTFKAALKGGGTNIKFFLLRFAKLYVKPTRYIGRPFIPYSTLILQFCNHEFTGL